IPSVRRVSLVGNTGSGKSTVAVALAFRLGVPCLELDAVFHQPGWTELAREEFRARVADAAAGDARVIDGNYAAGRAPACARADTGVCLPPSLPAVMRRWGPRTVRRPAGR